MVTLNQTKEPTLTGSITLGASAASRNTMNAAINSVFWVMLKDAHKRSDNELIQFLLLKQKQLRLLNKSIYERSVGSGILYGIQNGANELEKVNKHQENANNLLIESVTNRNNADQILSEERKASGATWRT